MLQTQLESLETRVLFSRLQGIDVSQFDAPVNWTTVKSTSHDFAFVRASRTNLNLDPQFVTNMNGAAAAGVLAGPYHRALPLGEGDRGTYTDPVTDANRFYAAAGAYMTAGHLRPVIDVEDGSALGRAALSQWANDFCARIQQLAGVDPIIYCNTNFARNYLDATVTGHNLWIANWVNLKQVDPQTATVDCGVWNQAGKTFDFWQYTSRAKGSDVGTGGRYVDLDVFNGATIAELQQRFVIGASVAPALQPSPIASAAKVAPSMADGVLTASLGWKVSPFGDTEIVG
jgi:lysozyme